MHKVIDGTASIILAFALLDVGIELPPSGFLVFGKIHGQSFKSPHGVDALAIRVYEIALQPAYHNSRKLRVAGKNVPREPLIVEEFKQRARSEGEVVLDVDVGPLAERGNFVGPMIVAGVRPGATIAQEEIFGPVLAVLRACDLDEALVIANGTPYALTGGLYSRGPARIARVKREFRVGNLYINRAITGAQVDRQPFGGFGLSGIGTKAGGSDYLQDFLLARSITENTLRRGFAPEPEDGDGNEAS